MFQLKRILLSGLVALLMVGMVTAGERLSGSSLDEAGGEEVERSYIGGYSGGTSCLNTYEWKCVRLEFFIEFKIPW